MAYYAIPGTASSLTSSFKGVAASWAAATPQRHKWYELILGAAGNPNATDTYIEVNVSRLSDTTSIAGSAFTPNPLDPADAASTAVSLITETTEPSAALIVNPLMDFGMNQRATTRWVAAQESQYLTAPATAKAGFYMRALSNAYTGAFSGQIYFME